MKGSNAPTCRTKSDAVYDLTHALVSCGVEFYTIDLLTGALRYFAGNPMGAERFIVEVQAEAYRRTQATQAVRLATQLAARRRKIESA
jgi:hypothetical protein